MESVNYIIKEGAMFLIPLVVLIITRLLKFVLFYWRHDYDWHFAFQHSMSYGHMPSVHTALMVSLVTTVGYYTGIDSGAFAVAAVIATLIIDDATRLRVYMGDLGRYINAIRVKIGLDEKKYPRLKERMGHRLSEVIAGALVGFFLTLLFIRWLG